MEWVLKRYAVCLATPPLGWCCNEFLISSDCNSLEGGPVLASQGKPGWCGPITRPALYLWLPSHWDAPKGRKSLLLAILGERGCLSAFPRHCILPSLGAAYAQWPIPAGCPARGCPCDCVLSLRFHGLCFQLCGAWRKCSLHLCHTAMFLLPVPMAHCRGLWLSLMSELAGSSEEGRDSHRALLCGETTLAWLFPSSLGHSNQDLAIAVTAGPTPLINVSELPRWFSRHGHLDKGNGKGELYLLPLTDPQVM